VYIIYVPWLTEEHKFGYVPRLTDERKFIYVPRFWAEERKVGYVPRFRLRNVNSHMFLGFRSRNVCSDIFLGWPSNISSYIPRCHVTEEYSYVPWSRCPCSLMFVKIYSSIPRNINYVSRPLTYVPRFLPDEYLPVSCSDQLSHHWPLAAIWAPNGWELLEAKYGNMNSANHEEDDGVTFPLRRVRRRNSTRATARLAI
jgi:hypothetical protein